MNGYLEIRNWKRYQHYKDRRPPWVKLHVDVLTDENFTALDPSARLLALLLLAVAANRDNRIPYDARWLAVETNMPASQVKKALATLLASGYLICDETASVRASANASLSRAPARSQEAEAETDTANGSPRALGTLPPADYAKEREVDKMLGRLTAIDEGTRSVLLTLAGPLPYGAVAKVRESLELQTKKVGPGWVVNALKDELKQREDERSVA